MFEMIKGIAGLFILLLVLGVAPVIIGTLFAAPTDREHAKSLTFTYMVGIMVLIAVSELVSVPMTFFKQSVSSYVCMQNLITIGLILTAILHCRTQLYELLRETKNRIKLADKMWVFVLLGIYVPLIVLAFAEPHIYGDDTTYLTMVNDMVYSDRLYLTDVVSGAESGWVAAKYSLSSFWAWVAYLARTSGIHPLILCKTILPFIFVPMSYAVQGLLAAFFFKNEERRIYIYMLLILLVSIFGGFSNYTVTYRLYTWSWQSKAFLAMIVIPFLLYYCNYIFEGEPTAWEYFILFLMIIATCATTLTGTGLAVAMVCVIALLYAIWNKKVGIVIRTVLVCCPAYALIGLYLVYDQFMYWIKFN